MRSLGDRLENALNESRMLLLGGQVLLGFSYRIVFEPRFQALPFAGQVSVVAALVVTTAAAGWLIWPAPFHRLAEHGEQTERLHRLTTRVLCWAPLPFAAALGLTMYPVWLVMDPAHARLAGTLAALFALGVWYFGAFSRRGAAKRVAVGRQLRLQAKKPQRTDLGERIKEVLIECRMALPGAQAFLGFQFLIVFTDVFQRLPRGLQLVHLASLVATTVAIVLLLAPAAYHRIALGGEDTEQFHRVATRLLLAALLFLAPGMCGDLMVVLWKIGASVGASAAIAGAMLAGFYGLWFGASAAARD
jgi:hypothetical protein